MQLPHFRWLDLAASVITVLGQGEVIGVVALGVTIVRLRARRRDWWVPLLFVVVLAIEIALKIVVPQAPPPRELVRNVKFAPFLEGFAPYAFPNVANGRARGSASTHCTGSRPSACCTAYRPAIAAAAPMVHASHDVRRG